MAMQRDLHSFFYPTLDDAIEALKHLMLSDRPNVASNNVQVQPPQVDAVEENGEDVPPQELQPAPAVEQNDGKGKSVRAKKVSRGKRLSKLPRGLPTLPIRKSTRNRKQPKWLAYVNFKSTGCLGVRDVSKVLLAQSRDVSSYSLALE